MAAVVRQVQPPRWKQSMAKNEFPQHPLSMVWVYCIGGVTEDETCKLPQERLGLGCFCELERVVQGFRQKDPVRSCSEFVGCWVK